MIYVSSLAALPRLLSLPAAVRSRSFLPAFGLSSVRSLGACGGLAPLVVGVPGVPVLASSLPAFSAFRSGALSFSAFRRIFFENMYDLPKCDLDDAALFLQLKLIVSPEPNYRHSLRSLFVEFYDWYYHNCLGYSPGARDTGVLFRVLG